MCVGHGPLFPCLALTSPTCCLSFGWEKGHRVMGLWFSTMAFDFNVVTQVPVMSWLLCGSKKAWPCPNTAIITSGKRLHWMPALGEVLFGKVEVRPDDSRGGHCPPQLYLRAVIRHALMVFLRERVVCGLTRMVSVFQCLAQRKQSILSHRG